MEREVEERFERIENNLVAVSRELGRMSEAMAASESRMTRLEQNPDLLAPVNRQVHGWFRCANDPDGTEPGPVDSGYYDRTRRQ
jgi:hypothetical protein